MAGANPARSSTEFGVDHGPLGMFLPDGLERGQGFGELASIDLQASDLDAGGVVRDGRPIPLDYFVSTTDTFSGSTILIG